MTLIFENNRLVAALYGSQNRHLSLIESRLGVELYNRGNEITIKGTPSASEKAKQALNSLYEQLQKGSIIDDDLLEDTIAPLALDKDLFGDPNLRFITPRRVIHARTPNQAHLMNALEEYELVFAVGPAGSGKTWLAVAAAVQALHHGAVERIILTRPAVEAGERLGFLPGDLKDKVDPYLRPIYDALNDMMRYEEVQRKIEQGQIEIAPLAYMRGRGLKNAFIILDEAQNTTKMQMKMVLTRLGAGSRMVITGDLSQIDLNANIKSGLTVALDVLGNVEDIGQIYLNEDDVVRHPLVKKIVSAYDKNEGRGE